LGATGLCQPISESHLILFEDRESLFGGFQFVEGVVDPGVVHE
jgi:hypothetical protein